jgi:hypothetical protein
MREQDGVLAKYLQTLVLVRTRQEREINGCLLGSVNG